MLDADEQAFLRTFSFLIVDNKSGIGCGIFNRIDWLVTGAALSLIAIIVDTLFTAFICTPHAECGDMWMIVRL